MGECVCVYVLRMGERVCTCGCVQLCVRVYVWVSVCARVGAWGGVYMCECVHV